MSDDHYPYIPPEAVVHESDLPEWVQEEVNEATKPKPSWADSPEARMIGTVGATLGGGSLGAAIGDLCGGGWRVYLGAAVVSLGYLMLAVLFHRKARRDAL